MSIMIFGIQGAIECYQGLFSHFGSDLNRLLSATRAESRGPDTRSWIPAVDIREEPDRYVLVADLPGVDRDAVNITVEDKRLTLSGERSTRNEDLQDDAYYCRERNEGTFYRQFSMPELADLSRISATADNGTLEIVVPKQEKLQPRIITVN